MSVWLCLWFVIVDNGNDEEPRMLGLAMVPGNHIKTICIDESELSSTDSDLT